MTYSNTAQRDRRAAKAVGRWNTRYRRTKACENERHRRLLFEPLESRRLLATLHTLTTGVGEGDVTVTVDGYGAFGSDLFGSENEAFFNPVGQIETAGTTFESAVALSSGNNGFSFLSTEPLGPRGDGPNEPGEEVDPEPVGDDNRADSSFIIRGLQFELTQTVSPVFNGSLRVGARLTQQYVITNVSEVPASFDLIRYLDGDLLFDGSIGDGGGRIETGDTEALFETDAGGTASTSTTFMGITTSGGLQPTEHRFEIDQFPLTLFKILGQSGAQLSDTVVGDLIDDDGFIDPGMEYDVTLALRNVFLLEPGASETYTTETTFGSGRPQEAVEPDMGDLDFGDAPAPYPTRQADNGAAHQLLPSLESLNCDFARQPGRWVCPTPRLGELVDAEGDGFPDANALGDDHDTRSDEDGVVFRDPDISPQEQGRRPTLVPGSEASIEVTAVRGNAVPMLLQGWIDFNQDGDWEDYGEQIVKDVELNEGQNVLTFQVPQAADSGFTFARFRYSLDHGIGPTGVARGGEVEDYLVEIGFTGSPVPRAAGTNAINPLDVNADDAVTPADALLVINELNLIPSGAAGISVAAAEGESTVPAHYADVNGDGWVTPVDALQVINYLNRPLADGERLAATDAALAAWSAEPSPSADGIALESPAHVIVTDGDALLVKERARPPAEPLATEGEGSGLGEQLWRHRPWIGLEEIEPLVDELAREQGR